MSNVIGNGIALNLAVLSNKIENQDHNISRLDERIQNLSLRQDRFAEETIILNKNLEKNTIAVNKLEEELKNNTLGDKDIQYAITKFAIKQAETEQSLSSLIKILSKVSIVLLGGIVTMIIGIVMRFAT